MANFEDLLEAIENEEVESVTSILEKNADLLLQKEGTDFNAIHCAVGRSFEIFEILLSRATTVGRFNIDEFNGYGETALHMAAKLESSEFAKALIEAGADVDIGLKFRGNSGKWSPLYLAAVRLATFPEYAKLHLDVAKTLIDAGATVDANSAVLMGENETLKSLIAENPNLGIVALDRKSLLEDAASVKNTEAIEILLKHGIEPNGEALVKAMDVSQNCDDDHSTLEILKIFLEAGAGEHLHTRVRVHAKTPYEYAIELVETEASYKPPVGFMELINQYNPESW